MKQYIILNTSRKHVNYEEDKNKVPINKPYNIQNTNICNGIFHISFFRALLINEGEREYGQNDPGRTGIGAKRLRGRTGIGAKRLRGRTGFRAKRPGTTKIIHKRKQMTQVLKDRLDFCKAYFIFITSTNNINKASQTEL